MCRPIVSAKVNVDADTQKKKQKAMVINEWLKQDVYLRTQDYVAGGGYIYQPCAQLSQADLDAWYQYCTGELDRKWDALKAKQTPRCAGGGQWIAQSMEIAARSSL